MYANTNLDMEENDRPRKVAQWERAYDNVIARIWNGDDPSADSGEEKALMSSAFMRAGARNTIMLPGSNAISSLPG